MQTRVATAQGVAVAYRRVSSDGQAGERHVSLEVQAARTEAYIRAKGCTLVKTFTDVASGRRDDRREYLAMLEFIRQGGASLIVTQFLDRFGRNPREILRRIWQLEEAGVRVECSDEDISQEMVLLVRAGVAGAESKRIGERVRHTVRRAVEMKRKKPGVAPYGYRAVKKVEGDRIVTTFEQDPVEAQAVREMVRMMVDLNWGLKRICDAANEAGYRSRGGNTWGRGSVAYVLRNPALVGRFEYGRQSAKDAPDLPPVAVENMFPAILTQGEWDALQNRLAIRRAAPRGRVHSSGYLLSGLVRCGYCGHAMVGHMGSSGSPGKRKPYRSYKCDAAARSRAKCGFPNHHKAEPLEQAVLEALAGYADEERVRGLLSQDSKRDADRREAELRRIDARLDQLTKDLKLQLSLLQKGRIDEEQLGRLSEEERTERQRLQERRATVETEVKAQRERREMAESLPRRIKGFLEAAQSLPIQQQKARLQELLKAVRVTRDTFDIEWR